MIIPKYPSALAFAVSCVPGTFILIILLSALGIYKDRLSFSLNKIFWVFCLFFMGLAPLLQYSTGKRPFAWVSNEGSWTYLKTNVLILACMLLFHIVYSARLRQKDPMLYRGRMIIGVSRKTFLFTGSVIFGIAVVAQFYLAGDLWHRQAADAQVRISNTSLQLLADKSLKGIVLYYCLLSLHLHRQRTISSLHLAVILTAAVLVNFPTAVPRYWLATFYLGLLLTCLRQVFEKRARAFELLLISGLAILFPLLTLARLKKEAMIPYLSGPGRLAQLWSDSFCGQDFDAYASLQNTLRYVQDQGLLWGKQISTTLLFFVPRSLWVGKSVGSGSLVNPPPPGSDFSNFSSPLFAEGYVDFGIAGALLFTALLAWIWSSYDCHYRKQEKGDFLSIMYPACLGLGFFMLRGDLLSSFAYTAGIMISAGFFHLLLHNTGRTAI